MQHTQLNHFANGIRHGYAVLTKSKSTFQKFLDIHNTVASGRARDSITGKKEKKGKKRKGSVFI